MTTSNKPEKKTDNTYGDYWSGKKPYLVHDYRKMMQKKTQEEYYFHELNIDPMSELLRPYMADPAVEPGMGWEYMAPPGIEWPGFDWPGGPILVGGECQLACNPSMLDCDGGCTKVACICGAGPLSGRIVSDPTGGHLTIAGSDPTTVTVCLVGDPGDLGEEYPKAQIAVSDGSREVTVEIALVNCIDCCDDITLSGDSTVNPSATWTGTIAPACPGVTCQVSSNSGCSLSCDVNGAGSQVTVAVGANDCGSFTVTVTDETDPACTGTDSVVVRINDTGQGGEWVKKEINYCGSGGCGCPGTYYFSPCVDEDTGMKFGSGVAPTCSDNFSYSCVQITYNAPSTQGPCVAPSCFTGADQCEGRICASGPYCSNKYWGWHRCEWECTC